jgi:hypothetical protein
MASNTLKPLSRVMRVVFDDKENRIPGLEIFAIVGNPFAREFEDARGQ